MNNHTLNAATKTVRILPMSPHESEGMSIGDVQRKYFRNQLCVNQGEYRCRQVLLSDPGTTVLFQYRSRIIASAVLIKWSRLDRPDRDGYTSVMHFDPATIRVFAPAGPEVDPESWTAGDGLHKPNRNCPTCPKNDASIVQR